MSFRARLVLAAAYLLTAVVLALEIPLGAGDREPRALRVRIRGAGKSRSARRSGLRSRRGRQRCAGLCVAGEWHCRSRRSRARPKERIVVTDRRGRVVADTGRVARRGTSYATAARPELRVALFGGRIDTRRRFSDSVGSELLLVTVPVVDRQRVVGAVRVSTPTTAIRDRVHDSWLRLAVIGVGVIAVGLVLAGCSPVPCHDGSSASPTQRRASAAAI